MCPCVRPCVCLFFSFSVLGVCSAFFLVLESFNGVSRKINGCLKFTGCFKKVLRMFQGSFNGVSRVFTEMFKGGSKKFKGCFKKVSRVFQGKCQGCFKGELSFSDATPIECVPSVRLVGVLVTQDLRWFQNTKFICEKERSVDFAQNASIRVEPILAF